MRPRLDLLILITCVTVCSCASTVPSDHGDGSVFPQPPRNHVTFWGHACCYIDVEGFGLVTDPVFAGRFGFRRRKIPVPPTESMSAAGLILVSHAHIDHLNVESIMLFPDSAVVLCPAPVAEYLKETGRRHVAMSPGDVYEYPHGEVVAVRAVHSSGRYSLGDGEEGGALGFVVTTPRGNVYYTGDTEYFQEMNEIGTKWRPEIAIMNFNPHLKDEDAVRAVWATRAEIVIPTHFGAYDYLLFGPLRDPRGYDRGQAMISGQVMLLQPGESVSLDAGVRKAAGQNPNPRRE
jgi:L-ascorbate metabolism protein UlaG (beta-lactamase superfamily)